MLTDDIQMSDSSSLVTTETLDDTDHTAEMTRTGSEEPLFFIDKEATNLPVSENLFSPAVMAFELSDLVETP